MNWIKYMDYYHEDFKDCFYFFDSYQELAEILSRKDFDYKDLKHKNIAYFKEMRKKSLKQWAQVLGMEYREYTDEELGLRTSGNTISEDSNRAAKFGSSSSKPASSVPVLQNGRSSDPSSSSPLKLKLKKLPTDELVAPSSSSSFFIVDDGDSGTASASDISVKNGDGEEELEDEITKNVSVEKISAHLKSQ
jgi:hypothetical protein